MQRWKITLAYDGTPFHGWQIQPGLSTVQGTLASALYRITGERLLPQGSGRTDTGVHALGQVATFDLAAPIPPANLLRALNRALPPSIRILSASHASPHFHARHTALRKTYEYRIFPRIPLCLSNHPGAPGSTASSSTLGFPRKPALPSSPNASLHPDRICPPTLAPYLWDCPWPLSLSAARQAAAHILGEHDFTSFAASDPGLATRTQSEAGAEERPPIRTIYDSTWTEDSGNFIYRITGSGFLHHMVRNLVGTFVDAAAGRIPPDSIPQIIAARNRSAAGPTAPARGLFLVSVEYPAEPGHQSLDSEAWQPSPLLSTRSHP